jgi:hypothetical protein
MYVFGGKQSFSHYGQGQMAWAIKRAAYVSEFHGRDAFVFTLHPAKGHNNVEQSAEEKHT